jgi:alkaline phosphatase D
MAEPRTSLFPQAVASFEPTNDGVLLWARLAGGATEASWAIARDPSLEDVVAQGVASTSSEVDHTITVSVDDLSPATTYWYRFEAGGERSPIGRTRTLPDHGVKVFRVATVCCADYAVAPLGVYRAVAEREVDLVLHLGDYIYEKAGSRGGRRHDPPHVATTLDDYRRRIAQVRSDPDAQALHLRHPMITIWDDHDLADNAWRDGAKAHDPAEHGAWPDRVAAAARARQEWLPGRLPRRHDPLTTWRSVVVGDLAELLLLDTRLQGRDRQAGDDGSPDLDDPKRSLLGPEQRRWLAERLADDSRPWSVIASGVVVNEIELTWPTPLRWINALLPNGYAILDGRVLHDDQWDGYPAERALLARELGARGERGGRTLILSGDVHSSWAFEGPRDTNHGEAVAVEVTTPAVSSAAMGRAHLPGMWRLLDRAANDLEHVRWAEVTERGYCTFELTPDAATATWWFVHPYDDEPSARAEPAMAFRSDRADWPPRLRSVEPTNSDPERAGPPAPPPPRPDDLRRLRQRRRARVVAEASAMVTALLAPLIAIGRRARR